LNPKNPIEKAKFSEEAVSDLADLHPAAFRTKYQLSGYWLDVERKTCPLLAVCVLGGSLGLVKKIYKIFPDAAYETIQQAHRFSLDIAKFLVETHPTCLPYRDVTGHTVIHGAALAGGSSEWIQYLVEKNPAIRLMKDDNGNTPLHCACVQREALTVHRVSLLVDDHATVLKAKNNCGWTPLHFACKYDAPFDVLRFLVDKWPDAVKQVENHKGQTPLALYCMNKSRTLQTVQLLLTAFPGATKVRDVDGNLPMELDELAELVCKHPISFAPEERLTKRARTKY
jgi:ankyrin repeat protein